MKYILLILAFGFFCPLSSEAKKKEQKTRVTAEVQGYSGKMIHFNFMEVDGIDLEFPYVENQRIEFEVELDDVTTMKINTFIEVCLQPGDSIHAKILFEGTRYQSVEYSGTPEAVAMSTALHETRMSRREDKYKENMPAAIVTLVDAKEYYQGTLKELKETREILNNVKNQVSQKVYNYVLSNQEAILLMNLISYPYACADYQKKKIEDCLSDGYWDVLNEYKLRDDDGSLRSRAYMTFLLSYRDYMWCKAEGNIPQFFRRMTLEEKYKDLADFYEGSLRDAALFVILYNSIANNGDFDRIEKLKKDYLKKYNKNKEYKKILAQIMR